MKTVAACALILASLLSVSCDNFTIGSGRSGGKIIDHNLANVTGLNRTRVEAAKNDLYIAYWHTSHGSQLVTGIDGMDEFFGGTGLYVVGEADGLRLEEPGGDLGNGDWDSITREWLQEHPETNVVMWSWCGQVSGASQSSIDDYLQRMTLLETEYPNVRFVYMTGHSDGTGLTGDLHLRNQQIRQYCEGNNKFLYDFYDIECYDPDGRYYGDKHVNDACDYDGGNWAREWQDSHPWQWWACDSAHSEPLNANLKAMAAWQLWARIAEGM
jgi:hypothetical protein